MLGNESVQKEINLRYLCIGLLQSFDHVGPGRKWKHGHFLIEKVQKVGGDQVEVTAIRPAAKQTIRKIIKPAFHYYMFLHIITYFYI